MVYFNSYDPNDRNRKYMYFKHPFHLPITVHMLWCIIVILGGDFTVGLFSQRSPYTQNTKVEVDPTLGRHDDFLLLGPYIFAQRNDSGHIHLYISYRRQPFNLAMIPTTDPHDVRKETFFHQFYQSTKAFSPSLSLSLPSPLPHSLLLPPNPHVFPPSSICPLSLSLLSHMIRRATL